MPWIEMSSSSNSVAREGLEEVTFEQKSELGEGQSHVHIWEKTNPGRGEQGQWP